MTTTTSEATAPTVATPTTTIVTLAIITMITATAARATNEANEEKANGGVTTTTTVIATTTSPRTSLRRRNLARIQQTNRAVSLQPTRTWMITEPPIVYQGIFTTVTSTHSDTFGMDQHRFVPHELPTNLRHSSSTTPLQAGRGSTNISTCRGHHLFRSDANRLISTG